MVDEKTRKRWKKEDTLKEENMRVEIGKGIGNPRERSWMNIEPKVNQSERIGSINTDFGLSAKSEPSYWKRMDSNIDNFIQPRQSATPSGPAYPSEPILTSKVSGWIGVFGDYYLCQLGCKKYASKKLDDVIKFFERELRLWYKAKELAKKGKLDVEVKGHVRKPRKKKEEKEIIKHYEQSATDVRLVDDVSLPTLVSDKE